MTDLSTSTFDDLIAREWLITNGTGSYASSTAIGLNTRKYHGLLVAAMMPPSRRMVLLSRVEETVTVGGRSWAMASVEYPGVIHPAGHGLLRAFSPLPHPRWAYQADGWTIEKSLRFNEGTGEVVLTYTLLGGERDVRLEIKPLFALRGVHELMYQWSGRLEAEPVGTPGLVRIGATARTPEVHFAHDGSFESAPYWYLSTIYRRERERGYAGLEDLWMPGTVVCNLSPGRTAHFAAAVEPIDLSQTIQSLQRQDQRASVAPPPRAGSDEAVAHHLARASDLFCAASAGPAGPAAHLVPQFLWSSLSVRDMLISLPGILLVHGRFSAARSILLRLGGGVRNGLVPSALDEQGGEPSYNACDTSLWLIHAVWTYFVATQDADTARKLLPILRAIIDAYQAGTELGIGINGDGLLRVRAPGLGPTWMNAQVGDWVITPRHGRPVEVNALWYNALEATAALAEALGDGHDAPRLRAAAERHRAAFNARFWSDAATCCYDVVYDSGGDDSVRPNQLLAIGLPYPVLAESRWRDVVQTVKARLLTPVGLRTLSANHPNYHGRYVGDVITRDRAYHQGCVFPWLLGPYADAVVRAYGPQAAREAVAKALDGCLQRLVDPADGLLPELFDGEPPHAPGGALADARSVGEVTRAWALHVSGVANWTLPNAQKKPQLPSSAASSQDVAGTRG